MMGSFLNDGVARWRFLVGLWALSPALRFRVVSLTDSPLLTMKTEATSDTEPNVGAEAGVGAPSLMRRYRRRCRFTSMATHLFPWIASYMTLPWAVILLLLPCSSR